MENPPVNLSKIAIGDGSIGELIEGIELPTVYDHRAHRLVPYTNPLLAYRDRNLSANHRI